ncbi:unnamed protein product, partial [Closterium sp. NIES-64]
MTYEVTTVRGHKESLAYTVFQGRSGGGGGAARRAGTGESCCGMVVGELVRTALDVCLPPPLSRHFRSRSPSFRQLFFPRFSFSFRQSFSGGRGDGQGGREAALAVAAGESRRFLQGEETDKAEIAKLRAAVAAGESWCGRLLNYKKDGSPFWNLLTVSPVKDDNGTVVKFIGMQVEVTKYTEGAKDKETRPNARCPGTGKYSFEAPQKREEPERTVSKLVVEVARQREEAESTVSELVAEVGNKSLQGGRGGGGGRKRRPPKAEGEGSGGAAVGADGKGSERRKSGLMSLLSKKEGAEPAMEALEEDEGGHKARRDGGLTNHDSHIFPPPPAHLHAFSKKERSEPAMEAVEEEDEGEHKARRGLDLATTLERIQKNFVITDPRLPENPIIFASDDFLELTEYSREEILGRNCRFLQGPDTDPKTVQRIRDAIKKEEDITVQLLNYTKSGKQFWNLFHLQAVRDNKGMLQYFIGVQLDASHMLQYLIGVQLDASQCVDPSIHPCRHPIHPFSPLYTTFHPFPPPILSSTGHAAVLHQSAAGRLSGMLQYFIGVQLDASQYVDPSIHGLQEKLATEGEKIVSAALPCTSSHSQYVDPSIHGLQEKLATEGKKIEKLATEGEKIVSYACHHACVLARVLYPCTCVGITNSGEDAVGGESLPALSLACSALSLACSALSLACSALSLACSALSLACSALSLACSALSPLVDLPSPLSLTCPLSPPDPCPPLCILPRLSLCRCWKQLTMWRAQSESSPTLAAGDLWAVHTAPVAMKPHKTGDPAWQAIQEFAMKAMDKEVMVMMDCPPLPMLAPLSPLVHLVELRDTNRLFAMKAMDKEVMVNRNKVHRACTERDILGRIDFPFLPTLYASFQTATHVCLITEFCAGGELYGILEKQKGKRLPEAAARFFVAEGKCLPEAAARFFVAEVLLALEYLHCHALGRFFVAEVLLALEYLHCH